LMTSQTFTDVTLVCDDKIQFEAHRIILISCSKFFETILNSVTQMNDCKPIIYLKGINHQELKSILEFMYIGEAKFSQERTSEFLQVATELELKSIGQNTENYNQKELQIVDKSMDLNKEFVFNEDKSNKLNESNEQVTLNTYECERVNSEETNPQILENRNEINCQNRTQINEQEEADIIQGNKSQNKVAIQISEKYLINEDDIKYECHTCSQCFSDEMNLKAHYEKYHQNFLCWCGFQAESKSDIDMHKLKTHKCITCTKCDFTADTYPKIFEHIKKEHKTVHSSNEVQYHQEENKRHYAELSSNIPTNFTCDQGDFTSSQKRNVKRHSNNKHGTLLYKKKKYFCNHCEYEAFKKSELKNHVYIKHGKCNYCEFTTSDQLELKSHVIFNHKSRIINLSNNCEHCDFKATHTEELRNHLYTHPKFQCEKCRYTTYMKVQFDHHIDTKHADKKLEDKIELIRATNGLEKFYCKACDYQSHSRINVIRHVKSEHLGIKFSCDQWT